MKTKICSAFVAVVLASAPAAALAQNGGFLSGLFGQAKKEVLEEPGSKPVNTTLLENADKSGGQGGSNASAGATGSGTAATGAISTGLAVGAGASALFITTIAVASSGEEEGPGITTAPVTTGTR